MREMRNALGDAWGEVIDLPVPRLFRKETTEPSPLTAAALPLLGWMLGLLPAVSGTVTGWLFNRYAGVLVFAFFAWGCFFIENFGRGDAALCRVGMSRAGHDGEVVTIPLFVLQVLRFAALAVLALNGGMALFPLILAGTFGIQAELATNRFNQEPLLPVEARRAMAVVMIAAAILAFFFCRIAALVLVLVFLLAQHRFADSMKESGFSADKITAVGNFTEWLLLIFAVLTA